MAYVVLLGEKYFAGFDSPARHIETIHADEAWLFPTKEHAKNVAELLGGQVAERI